MKTNLFNSKFLLLSSLVAVLASLTPTRTMAQAVWTGGTGDWNVNGNWSTALVPGVGTNAFITNLPAATVSYSAPMAAAGINQLTLISNTLNVSASGFNVAAVSTTVGNTGILNINSGGVMTNNQLRVTGTSASGAIININSGAIVTNRLTAASASVSADSGAIRVFSGAVADLGDVSVSRCPQGVFTRGLVIFGGTVTATKIEVGFGNSFSYMSVGGGTITNAGKLRLGLGTAASRESFYFQTNGAVSCADVVEMTTASGPMSWFTLSRPEAAFSAPGIVLFPNVITAGTARITNAGTLYLGASGLNLANSGPTYTNSVVMADQGLLGASANWTGNANMILSGGTFTFKAADAGGVSNNITLSGVLSGSGTLKKTGAGILTLNGANTHSGAVLISEGALAVGAAGALTNSSSVTLTNGAIYDLSAGGGTNVTSGKVLAGSGSVLGSLTANAGSFIRPGGVLAAGTLNFSNNLELAGGTVTFDLSNDPAGITGTNDRVNVAGDLTLTGTTTITIVPQTTLSPSSVYTLIKYNGTLTGDTNNLTLLGAAGTLTNDPTAKTISLITGAALRAATNVVWLGDGLANVWNTASVDNWLNLGTSSRDIFVTGDNAAFVDGDGATNPVVTIVGSVSPGSVMVNSTSNFVFTGTGSIDGSGSLTKTNAARLTILTTNNYSGTTLIGGGVLEVGLLANGLQPSPIGSSASDSANLQFFGGALAYTGPTVAIDRGATFNDAGAVVDVTNAASALTLGGSLTGNGSLTKAGQGTLTLSSANNYAGGTLVTNGVLRLDNAAGAGSGGLTNRAATIRIGTSTSIDNTVNFQGVCTVDLGNLGGNAALRGAWSGDGTVNFVNQQNATRTFTIGGNGFGGGNMSNFSGTINCGTNSGFFRFNDGGSEGSGPNFGSASAAFDLGTSTATLFARNGGTLNYLGALSGGASTTLRGAANNAGIVTYVIGGKGTDTTFEGVITNGSNGTGVAIVKDGAGKFTFTGTGYHTGNTVVSNGVLALSGTATIANSPQIEVLAGAILDVSALTVTPETLTLGAAQTLKGDGTVRGSIDGSGTVSPGASIGTLTVTNVASINGTLFMELNTTNGIQTNDVLAATVINGFGTLTLTNTGPTLAVGQKFTLLSTAQTGSIALNALPDANGTTYTWVNDLATDGSITVATVTGLINPNPTNITYSVSGNSLVLTWPEDHTGWKLQSQTNNLNTGLSDLWYDVADSETTNQVTVTINPANPTVFYRLNYTP